MIVPLVEGQSEVEAVPLLLRRIGYHLAHWDVGVAKPFRVKRNKIVKEGELERAMELALRDREGATALLVILDADDDCPVELAVELKRRAVACTDLPVAVVVANREFEGWFLGSLESLRGIRGVGEEAVCDPEAEEVRAAKARLADAMVGKGYVEVDDQPALVEGMDLELAAQNCRSFRKLMADVEWLMAA